MADNFTDNWDTNALDVLTSAKLDQLGRNDDQLKKGVIGDGWWSRESQTWEYSSADSPTFVMRISGDVRSQFWPGMRITLVQQSTTKYFIVTADPTYSAPYTYVTMYGGTDYTLTNHAITANFVSGMRFPYGFPADPTKWTVETVDTQTLATNNPVQNTWYNALSFTIPIGNWIVEYYTVLYTNDNSTRSGVGQCTLSTANNSDSDTTFSSMIFYSSNASSDSSIYCLVTKRKFISLSAKTPYYLNYRNTDANCVITGIDGGQGPTILRALSAFF